MPENESLTSFMSPLGMQHCVLHLCSIFNSLNLVRTYSGPGTVLGLGRKIQPWYQQLVSSRDDQHTEKQYECSVMVLGQTCRMGSWEAPGTGHSWSDHLPPGRTGRKCLLEDLGHQWDLKVEEEVSRQTKWSEGKEYSRLIFWIM